MNELESSQATEKKIRTIIMDGVCVDVFLFQGQGGYYSTASDQSGQVENAFIKVGVDPSHNLSGTIDVFLHEIQELYACINGTRFDPSTPSYGSDRFVFIMNHYQFSNACAVAAKALTDCYDELKRARDMEDNKNGSYFLNHP